MKKIIKKKDQPRLNDFLNSNLDGSYYVGHASVLFRMNQKLFLIDGVIQDSLFEKSWYFFPELKFDELFFSLDGIFVSHCHDDHYDLEFLRKIKKNTPIYITKNRIGFDELINDPNLNSIEIEPFKKIKLDDFDILAIPSDHNDFDSSFIIKNDSFSIYQGNDNFIPRKVIKKAADIMGEVSHVYIPFSYVWWYPFCLTSMDAKEKESEIKRLSEKNMNIGLYIAEELNAEVIIPSAGNLIFHDIAADHINRMIATPFDFIDYLKSLNSPMLKKTFPLLSGDYVLNEKKIIDIYLDFLDRNNYYKGMNIFLKKLDSINKITKYEIKKSDVNKINLRTSDFKHINTDLIFKSRTINNIYLFFDSTIKTFKIIDKINSEEFILFDIEDSMLKQWVRGKVTLETVLNSQRLLITREPEKFDESLWNIIRSKL